MAHCAIQALSELRARYSDRKKVETQIRNTLRGGYIAKDDVEKVKSLDAKWLDCQRELEYSVLALLEEIGLIDFYWTEPQANNAALNHAIGRLL